MAHLLRHYLPQSLKYGKAMKNLQTMYFIDLGMMKLTFAKMGRWLKYSLSCVYLQPIFNIVILPIKVNATQCRQCQEHPKRFYFLH